LLHVINVIGCFVRSCGAVAELKSGKELSAEQIDHLWIFGKNHGYIDEHDNVKESAPIINEAARILELKGRFFEVATFKNGILEYYKSVSDELRRAPKSYIQKVATNGEVGTHYWVVNYAGKILFDPYEPPVNPRKVLYTIVYAYKE
jgi:hypothetical protein